VRLRGETLKKLAQKAGVSVEQLAQAVERTGLSGDNAVSAIRNWIAGRDHPRCKAADIAKLAAAVGAQPKDLARFVSRVRQHRGSPRKAKLLVDMIRGKSFDEALNLLSFNTKRAAVNVRKALMAAQTEALLADADLAALYVSESRVDGAGMIKRFQPKDRGRAHPIEKRFSHITIGVEERTRKG
jgi:large subunit ribosomal protein L22